MLATPVTPAKTDEPMEKGQTGPRSHALDEANAGALLANTVERSVLGGDADCCCHYISNLFVLSRCTTSCWIYKCDSSLARAACLPRGLYVLLALIILPYGV